MARTRRVQGGFGRRAWPLIGLGGALLSGIGDVLILGRAASGRDFDQGVGVIPPRIEPDHNWRSLWNGAALAPRRIHVGTLTGIAGIGLLQAVGLLGIAREIRPGPLRRVATGSAAAFAVSGVLTHLCCGAVVLAYRRAAEADVDPGDDPRPSPPSVTVLLAASAAGALASLAGFSVSLAAAAVRGRSDAPTAWAVVTPLPCVLSTLLTFGALPAPVGGYARPASMSIGLMAYFLSAVATGGSERPAEGDA